MAKVLLLFFFGCLCHLAKSQNKTAQIPASTLSAGVETVIPFNAMNLISSFGLGASIKTTIPFTSFAAMTSSGGYTHYFGEKYYSYKFNGFNTLVLKGGIRLFTKQGFYFEPQVGYAIFISKGKESEGAFAYATNIGCVIKHIDISIKNEVNKMAGLNLINSGLRIAYVF